MAVRLRLLWITQLVCITLVSNFIQRSSYAAASSLPPGVVAACDFESSQLCLEQSQSDQADWRRLLPTLGSINPYQGNTYLTASHVPLTYAGDTAIVQTAPLPYTGPACAHFAYALRGHGVGSLNISVGRHGARATDLYVTGNQGDAWKVADLNIYLYHKERVLWTATLGDPGTNISIDDVWITEGKCPVFTCDFERTQCLDQSSLDSGSWRWTGLTTPRAANNYLYMGGVQGDTAIVQTAPLAARGDMCLHFAYHMQYDGRDTLKVSIHGDGGERGTAFTVTGDQGNQWIEKDLTVSLYGNERIRWMSTRWGSHSIISIDDIRVTPGECPLTACDFEAGLCLQQPTRQENQADWKWYSPGDATTGPHEAFSGSHYMYAELWPGDTARLQTAPLHHTGEVCVQFAHHVTDVCQLWVGAPGVEDLVVDHRYYVDNNRTNDWKETNVTMQISELDKVEWWVNGTQGTPAVVGLDHITVTKGACEVLVACDFEHFDCLEYGGSWVRHTGATPSYGTGPVYPHGGAHYVYMEGSEAAPGDRSVMHTAPLTYSGPACVSFAYFMMGVSMGTLTVATTRPSTTLATAFNVTGNQGYGWKHAEVTVHLLEKRQRVTWTAVAGSGYLSDIAVDDVVIRRGACELTPLLSCDFEADTCLVPAFNSTKWSRANRYSPPDVIWPSSTNQGFGFLHCDTSGLLESENATVLSPALNHSGPIRIRFSHYLRGAGVGKLSVSIYSRGTMATVYDVSSDQGNAWRHSDITTDVQVLDRVAWTLTGGPPGPAQVGIDAVHLEAARAQACGGMIRAREGVITSPQHPGTYPSPSHCMWTIVNDNNAPLQVEITLTDLPNCGGCGCDSITITEVYPEGQTWGPMCGRGVKKSLTATPGSSLMITMTTGGQQAGTGFWLRYHTVRPWPQNGYAPIWQPDCGWNIFNISLICIITLLLMALGGIIGYIILRQRREVLSGRKLHHPLVTSFANENFQIGGSAIEKMPLPTDGRDSPDGDCGMAYRMLPTKS